MHAKYFPSGERLGATQSISVNCFASPPVLAILQIRPPESYKTNDPSAEHSGEFSFPLPEVTGVISEPSLFIRKRCEPPARSDAKITKDPLLGAQTPASEAASAV